MPARPVQTWSARRLGVRRRLERVCPRARLFLMVVTPQQALAEAARCSGRHPSPCAQMLQAHSTVAVSTLESLSKNHATHVAQARHKWPELPGQRAMVVERPLQQRASLPPAHAKTCPHGQGWVVGQQGTPLVWILHDLVVPLRPIPW